MNKVETKREKEKKSGAIMIKLYCKKKHRTKDSLCQHCQQLSDYAQMREKIREIMRFSGPRMIFYHPIMAIRHVMENKKEKRRINSENNVKK